MVGQWYSENTQKIKFAIVYGSGLWCPKTMTILTSEITDYRSVQQTIIMKRFEIFQELPKRDKRQEASKGYWKMTPIHRDCHKLSIC